MEPAAKRKSLFTAAHTAARLACLVVAFLLAQTSVWGFAASQEHASAHFAAATPSSVGENAAVSGYDVSGSLVAAKSGGDILANSYRLGTPSTRANASALNRLNFDRAAPEIVRQRSTQLFSEVSGAPINGYYNQATNQIFLGKGSNLGTLTEELIHAGQRLDYGGRIPSNMINLMEQQAARKLDSLGFELIRL